MNESETRAEHIDPALKAAGWGVVDGSRILREYHITLGRIEGHGKRAKPDIADYVLVYRNHKLAVVEAKAWDKPLTEGVGQAKSYAGKLAVRYTYSTNGQGIYGIDMAEGTEGEAVSLVLVIHKASNAQIETALERIGALECVKKTPRMIRVENFA